MYTYRERESIRACISQRANARRDARSCSTCTVVCGSMPASDN